MDSFGKAFVPFAYLYLLDGLLTIFALTTGVAAEGNSIARGLTPGAMIFSKIVVLLVLLLVLRWAWPDCSPRVRRFLQRGLLAFTWILFVVDTNNVYRIGSGLH